MASDNGITIGQLTEQLNQKMDLPTGVSQDTMDYVVEWKSPTENDPTWYRKYKSGWLEQGGKVGGGNVTSVHLPKPFSSANYQVFAVSTVNGAYGRNYYAYDRKTDSFSCAQGYSNSGTPANYWDGENYWEAKGQGAE